MEENKNKKGGVDVVEKSDAPAGLDKRTTEKLKVAKVKPTAPGDATRQKSGGKVVKEIDLPNKGDGDGADRKPQAKEKEAPSWIQSAKEIYSEFFSVRAGKHPLGRSRGKVLFLGPKSNAGDVGYMARIWLNGEILEMEVYSFIRPGDQEKIEAVAKDLVSALGLEAYAKTTFFRR